MLGVVLCTGSSSMDVCICMMYGYEALLDTMEDQCTNLVNIHFINHNNNITI